MVQKNKREQYKDDVAFLIIVVMAVLAIIGGMICG